MVHRRTPRTNTCSLLVCVAPQQIMPLKIVMTTQHNERDVARYTITETGVEECIAY